MTERRFAGKVAFVTGAGSGIGRATAIAFAAEGAEVVLADIDTVGNEETARLVAEHGGRVLSVKCDVTSSSDIQAVIEQTVRGVRSPRCRVQQRRYRTAASSSRRHLRG